MTCTIGCIDGNVVVMGCDSASINADGSIMIRKGCQKIWNVTLSNRKSILVGFSGLFAIGLWIRHGFQWPKWPSTMTAHEWLVARVHPALQHSLSERFREGSKSDDDVDTMQDWSLLIGTHCPAQLFTLSPCGDVEEAQKPYAAIGAASAVALGCLFGLESDSTLPSWTRIEIALEAAERYHSSVRAPMHVEALIERH